MHRILRRAALAISASLDRATVPVLALCMATSCVLKPPSLSARMSSLPSGGGGPEPAPASEPVSDSQVIDAGCSFSGNDVKGEPGSIHPVSCPAGCNKEGSYVVGTDTYAGMSPVCPSAVHAGAIPASGGETILVLDGSRPGFRGSKRNGIESHDWGEYRGSFRFKGVRSAPPPAPVATGPVLIEAGCTFSANEIHGEPGTLYRVSCPAGCKSEYVYGTDTYSGHSPICVAAIHAGLATDRGGEFLMILEEGRPAYRGSKRNGVQSSDWGAHRRSYRFQH